MLDEIIKILGYPIMLLSCLGICSIAKRNQKLAVLLLLTLCFFIGWRSCSRIHSSRYYAALIFEGLFLGAFFLREHIKSFKTIITFIALFVSANIIITFSSFRNVYIYDIQDAIEKFIREEPQDSITVPEKEFARIRKKPWESYPNISSYATVDFANRMTDIYYQKSNYINFVYFITENIRKEDNLARNEKARVVNQFITNTKGNRKYILKHAPQKPVPDIDIKHIYPDAILKAYEPLYDTYVYQSNNMLFWLLGKEIDKDTVIIYHIHTTEASLLPSHRQQYGYDNRQFRLCKEPLDKKIGKYTILVRELPKEFPAKDVTVGFLLRERVLWSKSFPIDNYKSTLPQ